jgi:HK97 family phage major capsid protein
MQSIQALRERRTALAAEMSKMLDDNPGRWETTLQDQWDAKEREISDIDDSAKRIERMQELAAENAETDAVRDAAARSAPVSSDPRRAVFDKWIRGGNEGLSAEDLLQIRNTMSTTTSSQGGYTVPTEVAKSVLEALKAYGGMSAVSASIDTAAGNDMNFPTSDGTGETGELIAQNITATAADPSFSVVTLSTYKFSSKIVAVPFELLQDSAVDIEAFVRNRLVTRLGRTRNTYFTTGTGTSQPQGIVTAAGSGKAGLTGQTLTVIYDDLVDMVHSVDPAYRTGPGFIGWMMNDSSVKVIRKIKDTTGRPIWVPNYDASIAGGVPDRLLDYPIQVNQDVAVMAANAKSILFGNFGYYMIRNVMDVQIFRFTDSAYTKLGQVGFLAWNRAGGAYIGSSGTLAVNYYANSAT